MQIAPSKLMSSKTVSGLLPRKFSAHARFVGIDIGVDQARIVALGQSHRDTRRDMHDDGSLRWLSKHRFTIPVDPLAAPPSDWAMQTTSAVLNSLPRCVDGDRTVAAVSLPLPWVHYQVNPQAELEDCQRQCDAMFASSLFHSPAHLCHWNYDQQNDLCMIAATAESAAFELAQAVECQGYHVEAIVPHGQAMVLAAESMTGISPVCVLQLNRSGGLIAMSNEHGCGLCRTLPAIPAQILAACGSRQITLEEIESWLAEVANEIVATIRYATSGQRRDPNQPILLSGDVAGIDSLDSTLATLVDRPVAQWRYQGKSRPAGLAECADAKADESEFALALSLAFTAVLQATGGAR